MLRYPAVRLLWCAIGTAVGIALTLFLVGPPAIPFLLVSLVGSTVFLFSLTRAPATQPYALFCEHLGGTLICIVCYHAFGNVLWVYVLTQALALPFMLLAKTVHPPAGTNPILMIYAHAGWSVLWQDVFIGVASLAIVAATRGRLYQGLARYPIEWLDHSPPRTFWSGWDE